MKRHCGFKPRADMVQQCLAVGFDYYNLPSSDGSHYWSDEVAYEFSLAEIELIEDSANELHQMCLSVVADEVKRGDYLHYGFSDLQKQLIEQSWQRQDFHLYGRFDFGFDGKQLKLFEYNADTPTSLLESAIVQWQWLEQVENIPNRDQFNRIHEALIDRFRQLKQQSGKNNLHFAGMMEAGREDWGNIDYLCETAYLAGWHIHELCVEDIGIETGQSRFVDLNDQYIDMLFKLYPLEWLTNAEFAQFIPHSSTRFIEPMWKLLLSNKLLLVKLWQAFPHHPLLLPAFVSSDKLDRSAMWVKKPLLGREGANISYLSRTLEFPAKGSEHSSFYATSGYIYQEKYELPNFDGMYPMIGCWVVGDEACGIGIREDFSAITGNDSHFVPHFFVEE